MDVERGDLQVMMLVLGSGEALPEAPRLVVVDIGQRRNAEAVRLAVVLELLARLDAAKDVAKGLRAAGVASHSHVLVERVG